MTSRVKCPVQWTGTSACWRIVEDGCWTFLLSVGRYVVSTKSRKRSHVFWGLVWARSYETKSKRVYLEHVVSIVFNQDQLAQLKPLLENLNVLTVYQANIYQYLNFTHKSDPVNIQYFKKRANHGYPRNHSESRFYLKSTLWMFHNDLFPFVNLCYRMILLIKRKISIPFPPSKKTKS